MQCFETDLGNPNTLTLQNTRLHLLELHVPKDRSNDKHTYVHTSSEHLGRHVLLQASVHCSSPYDMVPKMTGRQRPP